MSLPWAIIVTQLSPCHHCQAVLSPSLSYHAMVVIKLSSYYFHCSINIIPCLSFYCNHAVVIQLCLWLQNVFMPIVRQTLSRKFSYRCRNAIVVVPLSFQIFHPVVIMSLHHCHHHTVVITPLHNLRIGILSLYHLCHSINIIHTSSFHRNCVSIMPPCSWAILASTVITKWDNIGVCSI